MNEKRGAWYLLTGLVIGLALGLVYSLGLNPIEFSFIAPQSLGEAYKEQYRLLIAQAFEANGDIGRAEARLSLLHDNNMPAALAAQAQKLLAEGGDPDEARSLAALEGALRSGSLPVSPSDTALSENVLETASTDQTTPSSTPIPPTATVDPDRAILTPTANPSNIPSANPTLTPKVTPLPETLFNAVFTLYEKREVCIPGAEESLLQIEVLDEEGIPLPGMKIEVIWGDDSDTFFTGLHPDVSLGYADFRMQPTISYAVRVGERGQMESGLTAVECSNASGDDYPGGWWLTFEAP